MVCHKKNATILVFVYRFQAMESLEKQLRKQLGLSQEEMALWLGIGRSLYSMIECGRRNWPLDPGPTERFHSLLILTSSSPKNLEVPTDRVAEEKDFRVRILETLLEETEQGLLKARNTLKKAIDQKEKANRIASLAESTHAGNHERSREIVEYSLLKMKAGNMQVLQADEKIIRAEWSITGLEAQQTFLRKKIFDITQ